MVARRLGVLLATIVCAIGLPGYAGAAEAQGPAAKAAEAPKAEGTAKTAEKAKATEGAKTAEAEKKWAPTYKIYTEWPFDAKEARRRQEETAKLLRIPVEKTIRLPYNVPMKFILIPAGEFVMGSPETEPERRGEEKLHRVRITLPYYIGKFEFLQPEWTLAKSVNGRGAANRSYHRHHGAHRPVDQASWMDAQRALWLMNQHKIGVFTLPTEAEWEFAARAGTTTPFHFGEVISYWDANYNGGHVYGKGKKSGYLWQTTDVGQFPPNAFGLYDMHGNVWEWCWDIYDLYSYINRSKKGEVVVDPSGPKESPKGVPIVAKDGVKHVQRGGGYGLSHARQLRSAARSSQPEKVRCRNGGFRVVMRTLQFPKAKPEAKPKPKPTLEDTKPALTKAGYTIYAKWPFDAKEAARRQQETAKALGIPVEKTITLPHDVAMTFVLIPAGEFVMGSPKTELKRNDDETQHRVRITTPYYLGKFEFLQGAWITGRMQGGKFAKNRSYQLDWKRPVEQASWKDAAITLLHLNRRGLGLFTLPTEAEWEFACRAGTTTPFSFGETISVDQANYDGNSTYGEGKRGVSRMKTVQGGELPANAFGLHEMHGNVWEWCYDFYDKDFYTTGPKVDPIGPKTGTHHVARGGAFAIFGVETLRSAARQAYPTERRGRCVGFRIVLRTLKPAAKPKPEVKE